MLKKTHGKDPTTPGSIHTEQRTVIEKQTERQTGCYTAEKKK